MKCSLLFLCYVFVALVSIYSAFTVESSILQAFLVLSAFVSFGLGIYCVIDGKAIEEKIKKLKDSQLSARFEGIWMMSGSLLMII